MVKKKATKAKETKKQTINPLDVARKAIEKKYGNVIKTMGDKSLAPPPTISTGSLGLDSALGCGGFVMGRVYEVYGRPSGGKCLTADTYISSEYGMVTIEELFNLNGTPIVTTQKEVPTRCILRNEKGYQESTSHFVFNGRRDVKCIKTDSGIELKATHNHKVRVVDPDTGFIVWKKSGNLTEGDFLVVNTKKSDINYPDLVDSDTAMFMGMLVAEGSLGYDNKFCFTNEDPAMLSLFEAYCETYFGKESSVYSKDGNTFSYVIHSKEVMELLNTEYGLTKCLAAGKEVPIKIRMSSNDIVAKFISTYFSLDGCYERKNRITASSDSKELLRQLQLLLVDRFGIKSTVRSKYNKVYNKDYYHIDILGLDTFKFIKDIGFILDAKISKVEPLGCSDESSSIKWSFPYQTNNIKALLLDCESTRQVHTLLDKLIFRGDNLSSKKISKVLDMYKGIEYGRTAAIILDHLYNLLNYACTKVVSISNETAVPVFDVVMPETHSFLSNCLISHNTTLAMSMIAQAQKRGLTCCFVDAERAADPKLFKSMGVDIDKLILIEAFTGDENLDALESLIKTGELDVAVIDSVSALIPKAEANAEMEDQFMGLLARLMSKAMRKFVPLAGETNTLLMFINQVRNKIGAYGDPETTTGGVALDFSASGRIKVSGGESKSSRILDMSGEVTGHHTEFLVKKNKFGKPYRKAHVPLIYGVGYDQHWECLNIAVDLGIIDKAGAWFKYNGNNIGQGEVKALQFLKEEEVVFNEIRDCLTISLGLNEYYERNS